MGHMAKFIFPKFIFYFSFIYKPLFKIQFYILIIDQM